MGRKAHELSICHVQFIVDNPKLPARVISKHTGLDSGVIRKIRRSMGVVSSYKNARKTNPETIAEICSYRIPETAELLEKYGYGDMCMSEVLQICGVS